ncbi:hypothetical protein MMIC_P1219 [Mariprofundus micogutta]|uniref:Uncharacterized protein n=1 Tax=Mariprofundus micogutta TaxID=1921010 RepID=A0A1L8CMV7_9PROT|nr:hypothetical protein [Mariprofundus micogutta]GAV20255.1 hypothetical protein MMIC_P1219 [Mariprofundus micogutta]
MLNRKLNLRGLSRLMIGLFAVQILAAGFCLISPESHSANAHTADMQMPMSADMLEHCDVNAKAESGHDDHGSACAHCNQPDELVQSKASTFNIDFDQPVLQVASTEIVLSTPVSIDLAVRTPTGPPRSSSLIYTTTKRIRI